MAKSIKKRKEYKPSGYWTKERCIAEAKKYKYYRNWRNKNEASLQAARRKGWYQEIKEKYLEDRTRSLSKDDVFLEAKKYKRRVDFQNKSPSFYAKALNKGWLDECCKHMMTKKESLSQGRHYKWTRESIIKTAKKFKTWNDLCNAHKGILNALQRLDMKKEVQSMLHVGYQIKWTYETLKKEALKYKNRLEFNKHAAGALRSIYDNHWQDELLNHMPTFEEQITKWTDEKLKKVILECKTKTALEHRYPGASDKVRRSGGKYEYLFEKKNWRIEQELLHPKIKQIIQKRNLKFLYESNIGSKGMIKPDFLIEINSVVYIIESKTEACFTSHNKSLVDNQVKKQIKEAKKKFKDKLIVHILLSEYGHMNCEYSNFIMSLKEFDYFLNKGTFKIINEPNKNKTINETSLIIRNEYVSKIVSKHPN